jgi:hypothetical protein
MAALRAHDASEAARLALLHKRSVQDSVSTLVEEAPAVADRERAGAPVD